MMKTDTKNPLQNSEMEEPLAPRQSRLQESWRLLKGNNLAFVGLFLGFLHGVAMKIMLEYGTAKNSKRYSTINEILVGVGFGIIPIVAGYVAEINIYFIFVFLVIFGISILVSLTFLSRKVKK